MYVADVLPVVVVVVYMTHITSLTGVNYADPCNGKSMTENTEFDYIVPDLIMEISKAYCNDKTHNLKDISPCNLNLDNFPPICMFIGECEILREQQEAFADSVRGAKGNVKLDFHLGRDMPHDYFLFAVTGMKECVGVFDKIAAFVKKCKNASPSSLIDVELDDVKEED